MARRKRTVRQQELEQQLPEQSRPALPWQSGFQLPSPKWEEPEKAPFEERVQLFGQSLEEDVQVLVEAARSRNLAPILPRMAQMSFEEQARLVGALRTRDLDLDPKTRQYLEQKIINPFQAAVGSVLVEQHLRPAETWATFQRISEQTQPGVPFWASSSGIPSMVESAPLAGEALSSPYPVSPVAAFREHLSTAGRQLKPEEVVRLKSTTVPAERLSEIPGLVTKTTPEGKPVIVSSVKAEKFGARASLWMKAQEVSAPGQPTVESTWGEQIPVWRAAFVMDPAAAALLPEGAGLYDPNLRVYRYYSFYRKVAAPGGEQVKPEEVIRPGTTLTGEELKRVQISPGTRPVTNLWRYSEAEVVSSGLFAKPGKEGEPPAQYSYAVFKVPVGAFEIKGAGAIKAGMAPDPLARRLGAEVVFSGAGNLQWVSVAEAWAAGNPEEAEQIIGRRIKFGESLKEEEVRKVLGYLSDPAHGYLRERAVRTRVSGRVLYGEFVPDDPAVYAALQEGRARVVGSIKSLGGEGSAASAMIVARTPVLSVQLPIQAQETLQYRPSAMVTRELVGQVLGFSQREQERALRAGEVKSEAVMETFKVIAAQMGMLPQEEVETRPYGVQGEWGGTSVRALGVNFAAALHAQSWLLSHGYKLSEMSVSEKIAAAMKAFSAITEGMDVNALEVTMPGGQRLLLPHPRYVSRLIGLPLDKDELKGEKAVSAGMYGSILLRALTGTDMFQGSVELPERVLQGYREWTSQIFRSGELLRTVGGGVVHRLGGIINPANYIPLNRVYIPQSRLGELVGRGKDVSDEEYERYLQEIAEGRRSTPVAVARIPALNETVVLRTISARELMELGVEEAQIRAMEESGAVYINPGIAYAKQGDLDRDVLMALKAAIVGAYRRVKEGAGGVVTRLRGAVPTSMHRLREMMLSSQEVKERVEKVRGAAPEKEMLEQARQRMTALQELSVQDLIQVSIEQELNRQQAGPSYNAVERSLAMAYGESGIPRGIREKLMLLGYQQNIDLKAAPPEIQRLLATLGGAARPSGTPENEWSNPIWTETVAAVMGLGEGFTDKELAQLLVNPENQSNYQKVLEMVRAHRAGEKVYPTDWMLRFWEGLGEKYLAEHPEVLEGKPEASRYIYQLLYGVRQAGGLPYASMLRMTGAMMDVYPAWDEKKQRRFGGILSALMDVYPEARELRGRLWLLRHGSAETVSEAQKRFAIAANAPELLQWMRSQWGPKVATLIAGKAWRALPKELQAPELFSSAAEQASVVPPPSMPTEANTPPPPARAATPPPPPAEVATPPPPPAEATAPPPPPPPTGEAPVSSVPSAPLPSGFSPGSKYRSTARRIARARAQNVLRTLGSRYITGAQDQQEAVLQAVTDLASAYAQYESIPQERIGELQAIAAKAGLDAGAMLRDMYGLGSAEAASAPARAEGAPSPTEVEAPASAAAPAGSEAIPLAAAAAQIDADVEVRPVQAPPRQGSPAGARAVSPEEVEKLSKRLYGTVQQVAGILRDLNEGELPEDARLVGGAALRKLAAGEFRSMAEFVQALSGNLPRARFRSLTRVAAAYFAGRPLSAEAITTVREFLGDEETRAVAYELERPSVLAREGKEQRARLNAMIGGLTSDDAVAYEGFRQLLPQIGEFTKRLKEATDGVKDFGEFLEKIGGEEEYRRLAGISNLARGAARYAAKFSESPEEREQIITAASQLSQAIVPARAMEKLAALNPPPPPPKWRRADWQGSAWDEEGFHLGAAFSHLTGGWSLWWLRRWWGITGGQAWSAAREASALEQTYQQMVWSSTGGQPQLSPMTADMMRFYSSLAAARLEMGRTAYSAYWANFQIPQGLGSVGGLALPALGVGGTLAGLTALSGLLSWGTAIGTVGAPAALITLAAGLASYGVRLSEDRPRYVLASQGYGSALDRFLTGEGGTRIADAFRRSYFMSGSGLLPSALPYEESLQRTRQQEAETNRLEAQRLLYGDWEQLNPAEREAVLRGVVQRLTQKGQPFQYWTEETLQGAVGAIAHYVGINPRDLMMGQGQQLLQYMLAANLSGQDTVRLARMLNVRPLEVPQTLGQFGGLYSITRASDIIDRYYGGFLNYGVEFQDLAQSVLSGRLPDILPAQQQYFLSRLLAREPRAWAQMAVAMGTPTLAYQDLMGLPLGVATPLPVGMSGAAFSRMMRASQQQIMERLFGGLSFIGGWGEDTLWGLQDEMTMANLAYQRQHAALQRRQMALNRQFVTGVQWPYQDVMRQMEYAQQMGGTTPGGLQMTGAFNWQIISANQSLRQFLENWELSRRQYELSRAGQERDWTYQMWTRGFQRETALLQRGWTREDWAISAARAGIEFGWSLEDINEAIRYSTGLQRRQLLRERDRLVTRFGWSQEDRERTERRQEELWKRQDEMWQRETAHLEDVMRRQRAIQDLELERLELARRHYLEDHELRMRQIEEAKAFWQEQWERQSAYIQRQREYELAQMDLQRQQLELSIKHAEVVAGLQLSMTDLTRKMQVWQNLVEVEVPKALQRSFEEIVRKLADVVAGTQFGSLPAPTGTHPHVWR